MKDETVKSGETSQPCNPPAGSLFGALMSSVTEEARKSQDRLALKQMRIQAAVMIVRPSCGEPLPNPDSEAYKAADKFLAAEFNAENLL